MPYPANMCSLCNLRIWFWQFACVKHWVVLEWWSTTNGALSRGRTAFGLNGGWACHCLRVKIFGQTRKPEEIDDINLEMDWFTDLIYRRRQQRQRIIQLSQENKRNFCWSFLTLLLRSSILNLWTWMQFYEFSKVTTAFSSFFFATRYLIWQSVQCALCTRRIRQTESHKFRLDKINCFGYRLDLSLSDRFAKSQTFAFIIFALTTLLSHFTKLNGNLVFGLGDPSYEASRRYSRDCYYLVVFSIGCHYSCHPTSTTHIIQYRLPWLDVPIFRL